MNLLQMLATKHSDAVFVPECSMGSSGSRRLDAWVLLKTWSPWTTVGYEIKTARADFLRDRKWAEYLPVCHELYFVSPAKLIQIEELPQDVGLMWAQGSRLVTKRKALRREVDAIKLLHLMSYVLMSRSRIVANMWEANGDYDNARYWRSWLESKSENRDLGKAVSRGLRQRFDQERSERHKAERERDRLQSVADTLERLGLNRGAGQYEVERMAAPRHASGTRIAHLAAEIQRLAKDGA